MAYNSSSKRLLQDYKQEYDPFVSQDGLCEDKGKDMKDYLDRYRDSQTVRESLFETILKDGVSQEIDEKMKNLRGRITSYAFDRTRDQVISMKNDALRPGHVSHIDPATGKCLCVLQRAYRLPCKHKLREQTGPIPLVSGQRSLDKIK
ncbi:hypothetical protein HMPREF1544_09523 [Mucor circinelloides 1006PhL]|uniref:SWIM-type domain-containing protein n=1 Tax=Mucor circinelloides f. circinelloides (strain 1006PhL) TaxID=1220926 RepID=S2J257_MUCC1|nr:hypothetical protein HMPREF1544_09523 [Mucor circinelloides 1006PhL]